MKIGCLSTNQYNNSDDQWLSARSEGRTMINAGFGFAEMGHEVGIFAAPFTHKQNVWKGASLYPYWDDSKDYDLIVAFNPYRGSFGFGMPTPPGGKVGENYSKLFYVHYGPLPQGNPQEKIVKQYPKTVAIFSAAINNRDILQKHYMNGAVSPFLRPIDFFPQLFPIPCYDKLLKQDFQDYHFDRTKKKLKIWTVSSHWHAGSQSYVPDASVIEILRILRDNLKYEIDLTVTSFSDASIIHPDFIKVFNAKVIKNLSYTYKDILDLIYNMDICIVRGASGTPANSSSDILSLGVPIIYVVNSGWNPPNDFPANSIMQCCLDDCINLPHDSHDVILAKISKQMEDPQLPFERMRLSRDYQRFPNWEKCMNKLLNKYC